MKIKLSDIGFPDDIAEITAQKEKIIRAFIAETGAKPSEIELVVKLIPNGYKWHVQLKKQRKNSYTIEEHLKLLEEEGDILNKILGFKELWKEWFEYRKELKKKLTLKSAKQQLNLLKQHPADAVDIINNSIMNGWQGLFPPKKTDNYVEVLR